MLNTEETPYRTRIRRLARTTALLICSLGVVTLPAQAEQSGPITFGAPNWPGVTVKTEVASQILEGLGYETETIKAETAIIVNSIAQKKVHAALGLWRPSQNGIIDPVIERGEAIELTANIEDARYQSAVPKYVWDAGVRSMADLAQHAEKFDRKLYGIEAGSVGNEIVSNAIKANTYGLKGWQVVPSSTPGMLSQVERAVSRDEWIVFNGWQPHWMNVKFDMKYLADPEGIWGKKSTVYTIVHPDFVDESPNVARFLKQMVVPKAVQSQWILEYGYNDRSSDDVAREWIAANKDIVAGWVEGVTNAAGDRSATETLAEQFGGE